MHHISSVLKYHERIVSANTCIVFFSTQRYFANKEKLFTESWKAL